MNDQEQRRCWIKQWEVTGHLLREKSKKELRELTVTDRQKQIQNLLDLAVQFHHARRDDGLVKMKKAFAELFAK